MVVFDAMTFVTHDKVRARIDQGSMDVCNRAKQANVKNGQITTHQVLNFVQCYIKQVFFFWWTEESQEMSMTENMQTN